MANKRVFVLCDYPFPEGMAATNRILAYCKGLNQNGIEAEVISFTPHARKDGNANLKGSLNGVTYHHSHSYNPSGNKWYRVFVDLRLFKINALRFLLKENRRRKIDLVIVSFDRLSLLYYFVPVLRLFNIPMAFISDEYPAAIRQLKSKISDKDKTLYKIIHRAFKFRIVMTEALKVYYNDTFVFKPTLLLNTIVDVDRINGIVKNAEQNYEISYVGNLELAKDNVDNIINAFSLLVTKYPFLKLHLYGTPNEKDLKILTDLVHEKLLQDHVFFKGRISFDQVPKVLADSFILVTSQPQTKRAEGGFPTKLGEYLLSGTPTILTDVGEIARYITDKVNAYLVAPSQPGLYAEKIEYILNNYEEALKVAEVGKAYVIDNFSSKSSTKQLADFINNNFNATDS